MEASEEGMHSLDRSSLGTFRGTGAGEAAEGVASGMGRGSFLDKHGRLGWPLRDQEAMTGEVAMRVDAFHGCLLMGMRLSIDI